jgi:predicted DNA-binding transcriptional regulator YafY
VSVRTVYRDVAALQAAGVPVYGEPGPAGGYRLVAGYHTRLTGLTLAEAETLLLAGLPGPAAALGMGGALAAARVKLLAALPAEARERAGRVQQRFLLDAPGWYEPCDESPFLAAVADAVWQQRAIRVRYSGWSRTVERRLEPYGLVLKAGRWYVVAGCGPATRTYRVNQILALEPSAERFDRPAGFALAGYWQNHLREFGARLHRADAVARFSPAAVRTLRGMAARSMLDALAGGLPQPDGWTLATVPIESLDHAEREFLALGADVEVLEPAALRARLARAADRLAALYRTAPVTLTG